MGYRWAFFVVVALLGSASSQVTKVTDGTDPDKSFTDVQVLAGGKKPKEQLTVAMEVKESETSDTVYQANAHAAYVESSSSSINAVASYTQAVCTGGKCWGANPIAYSKKGKPSLLFGLEANVNANNKEDTAIGVYIGGGGDESPSTSYALLIGPLGMTKGKMWEYGLVFDWKTARIPIAIYPTSDAQTSYSAPIQLWARNNGHWVLVSLQASPDGKLCVNGRCY